MRTRIASFVAAWSLPLLHPALGLAQDAAPQLTFYQLRDGSTFEVGCFGPCACPIISFDLKGTFWLSPAGVDPLFAYYDVTNLLWRTLIGATEHTLTGSGRYRVGGEFASQQEMTLDLSIDGGPLRRFASGLVLGGGQFPAIDIELARRGFACWDTVLQVRAGPVVSGTETGLGRFRITTVGPNPFRDGVQVGFELPTAGSVLLRVFDVAGREVSIPASGSGLGAGVHWLAWDGRTRAGRDAPAGLYIVRLETGTQAETRTAVKLR